MGLSPSERRMKLGHVNIQKGLGSVEAVKAFYYIHSPPLHV